MTTPKDKPPSVFDGLFGDAALYGSVAYMTRREAIERQESLQYADTQRVAMRQAELNAQQRALGSIGQAFPRHPDQHAQRFNYSSEPAGGVMMPEVRKPLRYAEKLQRKIDKWLAPVRP